jgi:hypothetical protein
MKFFTVRELDRQPATVLDAADEEGIARIRRRDGRTYSVLPEGRAVRALKLPDFRARRSVIFGKAIPSAHVRKVDKLIAGE